MYLLNMAHQGKYFSFSNICYIIKLTIFNRHRMLSRGHIILIMIGVVIFVVLLGAGLVLLIMLRDNKGKLNTNTNTNANILSIREGACCNYKNV